MKDIDTMHRRAVVRLPVLVALLLLTTATTLLAVASPSSAASASLYVDRTVACSDTGAGTSATPYCTISKGVAALRAGRHPVHRGRQLRRDREAARVGHQPQPGDGDPVAGPLPGHRHRRDVRRPGGGALPRGRLRPDLHRHRRSTASTSAAATTSRSAATRSPHAGQPRQGADRAGDQPALEQQLDGVAATPATTTAATASTSPAPARATPSSDNQASFNAEGWQRNANGIDVISPGNTSLRNVTARQRGLRAPVLHRRRQQPGRPSTSPTTTATTASTTSTSPAAG